MGGTRSTRYEQPPALSEKHRVVLNACVCDADEFVAVLDRLRDLVRARRVDHAGQELLAFVHRRIVDLDVDHPLRAELQWAYRTTWHHNQLLLFRARPLLAHLDEIGARSVVLKGGAMVSSAYYGDLGVRPLMDLDVLVDREWVAPAVDWALANGWSVSKGLDADDIFIVHHAIDLEFGDDGALDLHWALLVQGRNPERERALLRESRDAMLGDVAVRVLPPTYQVFHTAAHAKPEGIRHIVDMCSIVDRCGDSIDWSAVVDEVVERRTLAYTARTFALVESLRPGTIPADALVQVLEGPRHWSDRAFHGAEMETRRDVVRRFAADVAGRSRGEGFIGATRVARAMVRRFSQDSGWTVGDLSKRFAAGGGRALERQDDSDVGS